LLALASQLEPVWAEHCLLSLMWQLIVIFRQVKGKK